LWQCNSNVANRRIGQAKEWTAEYAEHAEGPTTKIFWRNKAEQSGTLRMAEGFWGRAIENVEMAEGFDFGAARRGWHFRKHFFIVNKREQSVNKRGDKLSREEKGVDLHERALSSAAERNAGVAF
jgi:hypothetical protein